MGGAAGPTIVKLGGSHAFSAHLDDWLEAVAGGAGRVVVVPGGGPFADTVRAAQPKMGFDDRAAHHMALLAMEQYGCALASLRRPLTMAASAAAIRRMLRAGRVPVWAPARMALQAKDVPWSWDVTADSLAAWLAGILGAKLLLLVKPIETHGPLRAADLVARRIVDPAFPRFLGASGAQAYIAGPSEHAAVAAAIRAGSMAGARIDLE
jgi:5-(aminomethyl)-3-furanmethanol phosphate kinase